MMNEFDHRKYIDHEAAWLAFRRLWLQSNPPLDNGYYLCGVCGHWVRGDEVTLDHIEPRTASNMYEPNNIQPAHGGCNYRKGSRRWKPKVSQEHYEFLNTMSNM